MTREYETYISYMVSWSPKTGEATYTRGFDTQDERDAFVGRISSIAKCVHTWDKECCRYF